MILSWMQLQVRCQLCSTIILALLIVLINFQQMLLLLSFSLVIELLHGNTLSSGSLCSGCENKLGSQNTVKMSTSWGNSSCFWYIFLHLFQTKTWLQLCLHNNKMQVLYLACNLNIDVIFQTIRNTLVKYCKHQK